jgi:glycosyltransferase involved in cell wall biosynthesis
MPDSVHAARWVGQLRENDWDIHVFPVSEQPWHPSFRDVTSYGLSSKRPPSLDPSVRLRGILPTARTARLRHYWRRAFPQSLKRSSFLAALIRRLQPDVVHTLEIQHAGYLTREARGKLDGRFPPWIVSNWGSDIHLFGRFPEHKQRIRDVMTASDYYAAECNRDIELGRRFGFQGEIFGVFPVGGGFDIQEMQSFRRPGRTSARRVVVLNGRQDPFGQAIMGLRALALCADALRGYRIVVPLATPDVQSEAERVGRETGLEIEAQSDWVTRERILALYGGARVSIRLGVSDGASHTLLEAMPLGSFPIIAHTACADEWIVDGESGLIVPPSDPQLVADALHRALTDDALVDAAAERNAAVAAERLDAGVIRRQVVRRYEEVLETART